MCKGLHLSLCVDNVVQLGLSFLPATHVAFLRCLQAGLSESRVQGVHTGLYESLWLCRSQYGIPELTAPDDRPFWSPLRT